MNRLYPAETRLKEGAHAHDSDQNRWECSLAAGGWRPVSALLAVSRDSRFDVNTAKLGNVARGEAAFWLASALDGGRTWWAIFAFTRINIAPTILRKKIEDLREAGASGRERGQRNGFHHRLLRYAKARAIAAPATCTAVMNTELST
jgi:hypothetical protein